MMGADLGDIYYLLEDIRYALFRSIEDKVTRIETAAWIREKIDDYENEKATIFTKQWTKENNNAAIP